MLYENCKVHVDMGMYLCFYVPFCTGSSSVIC